MDELFMTVKHFSKDERRERAVYLAEKLMEFCFEQYEKGHGPFPSHYRRVTANQFADMLDGN